MNKSPEVSVVMSVYNGADKLEGTLKSILSQEGVDLEFIIVNDGSTDKTFSMLQQFAENDERLRIIDQENRGLTHSLIRGCAEAKGGFIARQDAGDVSQPGRLRKQADLLRSEGALSFVSCWTEFIGPGKEMLFLKKGSGIASDPVNILSDVEEWGVIDGPSCHPSVMFRRKAYLKAGGYRGEFYFSQDWDLWYRLGAVGQFMMVREVLYCAEISIGTISATCKQYQEQIALLSRKALSKRLKQQDDSEFIKQISQIRPQKVRGLNGVKYKAQGMYFIGECLRRNNDIRARNYFIHALKFNPLHFRSIIRLLQMGLKIIRDI